MTRMMYDSTNPNAIPANAQMVAGYVTGFDQNWPPSEWSRFSGAVKVRICTRGGVNDGDVLDMESGAAAISDAVPWLQMRRAATGVWKSLYYSESLDGSVQAALRAGGIDSAQIPKWIAWYGTPANLDDVANIPGIVAKQYANSAITHADYDLSVVADHWPGVDSKENEMTIDQAVRTFAAIIREWYAIIQPTGQPSDTVNGQPFSTDLQNLWCQRYQMWLQGDPNGVDPDEILIQAAGRDSGPKPGGGTSSPHVHSLPGGNTGTAG